MINLLDIDTFNYTSHHPHQYNLNFKRNNSTQTCQLAP